MTVERSGPETSDFPLRLVREVAHSLAQAESSNLPQVLCRIVEAAYQLSPGLREGAVSLLDHAFGEQYFLAAQENTPSSVRRQKFSEQSPAPVVPMTPGPEASPDADAGGSNSIRVPVVVGSQDVGLLSLGSRTQRLELSTNATCALEILASLAAVAIERRRNREEAQQDLLVHANAVMVGQIATSFIHEAKNSLNGMTLTVYNLCEDIKAEADQKGKKDYLDRLSVILTEMQRLDSLSRRLQRFTRQGLRPEKREAHLNEIVKSVIQLLDSVLREKQMRFEIRLDPRLAKPKGTAKGNPLLLDESQIQQVLMNLILNAVAFSPDRSPLQIDTSDHERFVEIRVRDFGEGIPADNMRRIFTPFFTTKNDGVGLGLYISKLMIEDNHHGEIEVESTAPGKGTTFLVRLPKPA